MDYYQEALKRFRKWLKEAEACGLTEPTAMALATADNSGRPSVRTVLLKHFDSRGFVFYTNEKSRKGRQIQSNARAAACFYWDPLHRQVIIEGPVERISEEESEAYWKTRPRESQIGAWASIQSSPLRSRVVLLGRVARYQAQYAGRAVPRPSAWRGFRVVPDRMEFWIRRRFRLHDRMLYYRDEEKDAWQKTLVFP